MRYSISYVKCDRCGKVFEEVSRSSGHYDSPITMWMQFQSYNGRRTFSEGQRMYNLCIDCEREFIDWFTNKMEEKPYDILSQNS